MRAAGFVEAWKATELRPAPTKFGVAPLSAAAATASAAAFDEDGVSARMPRNVVAAGMYGNGLQLSKKMKLKASLTNAWTKTRPIVR